MEQQKNTRNSKARRSQQRTQSNTISKYFHPLQAATPRKREGQGQTGNSSKVKYRKINAQITEVHDTSDNEYEHRQKEGPMERMIEYHKLVLHIPASKVA